MKKKLAVFAAALVVALTCFGLFGCREGRAQIPSYQIVAGIDVQNMRVNGELRLTYQNATDTELTALRFHLFGRAYREGAAAPPVAPSMMAAVYPKGVSYGDMSVGEVTDGTGKPLSSEITGEDEHILLVSLATGLFPGEKTTVVVPFSVDLACIRHRLGYTDRAINLGNWYPVLCVRETGGEYECVYATAGDPFYSECADYDVTFTCPEDYVLASSGTTVSARQTGGGTTYQMRLSRARDFAMVLSKDFTLHQTKVGEVDVRYYCYDDARAEQTLETLRAALSYFARTFGAYPYPTYTAVQTPFSAGGMEYPALVMISDKACGVEADVVAVHETAHQWWYGIVGNNQMEQAWLDEGLAEYATCVFFENHPSYGITRQQAVAAAESALRAFVAVTRQIKGEADTAMNRNLRAFSSEYEYVNVTYNAGLLLFDGLRQSVGDKKFFAALLRYRKENEYGIAREEDLVGAFERSGVKVRSYVESWTQGKIRLEK